jgi:hypothetical protein
MLFYVLFVEEYLVLQPPDDLAVAYNNRCFADMKLGELNKALEDCTMSLKYGQLREPSAAGRGDRPSFFSRRYFSRLM